jgi:hypothetical protein
MSTKTTNGKAVTEECRWPELFTQLREDRTEFFMNSQLEPTLLIPGDGFRQEWPVDSQRVQDLLTTMYYELTTSILKSTERELLLSLMREECRRGGRRLTEDEAESTEQDVIVQGIVALVNAAALAKKAGDSDINPVFNGRTANLQELLTGLRKKGQISAHEEIPIFTNIFARKLNRLIPVLRGYGIEVAMEHKEDGSYVSVNKLETFQPEMPGEDAKADASGKPSSGESSVGRSNSGSDYEQADDADAEKRYEAHGAKENLVVPTVSNGNRQAADSDQLATPEKQASLKKGGAK